MPQLEKYMFDLDFDHAAPPDTASHVQAFAPPPDEDHDPEQDDTDAPDENLPAPTFSEEEVLFARDQAFEEGRQTGLSEAMEASERIIANALDLLANQIPRLFQAQEDANDANARNAARVAMAVLRKILPAACEKHGFEEVTRVVEEVVGHILDEPRIIVKVAPPLVDGVRERLEAACDSHGFEGRVVVQADPRMEPGDARVEWTDGGAQRDQKSLMNDIESAVERALAPPERRVVQET